MYSPPYPIVIAIDGFSSCGKSSFAKDIAREMQYAYIDTGAMYRAVTLYALQHKIIEGERLDVQKLIEKLDEIHISFRYNPDNLQNETWLNGIHVENDIRSIQVSEKVSEVSAVKEVRDKLVRIQKGMGVNKAVVMDGRDIGSVVFPHADIKLFMTAGIDIRAQRRYDELLRKGMPAGLEEIKNNLAKRDYMDQHRVESPLMQADDAVLLDNSYMTPAKQIEWFDKFLRERFSS